MRVHQRRADIDDAGEQQIDIGVFRFAQRGSREPRGIQKRAWIGPAAMRGIEYEGCRRMVRS